MTRVTIDIRPQPYEAIIASGLFAELGSHLCDIVGPRPFFVVTVPPVRNKWGKKFMAALAVAGLDARLVEMRDGERSKQLATVAQLAGQLAQLGADRSAVVIALGGGVVGDVAGLLASLYMRGVDVVQVPTTVLAQVDASIGGKTGVNLPAGKNLLGTFHQPRAVLIDPDLLATLPDREFRAGLYESLKGGIIGNPDLFHALEQAEIRSLRRDAGQLEWVIAESVKLKAKIVSADVREGGPRRFLNLGHTIGHALESETGYRHFLHGEAVAWGMVAAANIAVATRRTTVDTAERITKAVLRFGPLPKVDVRSRSILRRLQADKKTQRGIVHFVLPREIGKLEVVDDVPEKIVIEAIDQLRRLSRKR